MDFVSNVRLNTEPAHPCDKAASLVAGGILEANKVWHGIGCAMPRFSEPRA
jgi:hypothetical protein